MESAWGKLGSSVARATGLFLVAALAACSSDADGKAGGDPDAQGVGGQGTGGKGGAPEAGAPLPDRLVIAQGLSAPTGLAVNAAFVYFANRGDGTIARCPHAGCGGAAPDVIVTGQDNPIALALDGTHLYWVTGWRLNETGAPPARPVSRCELPDCQADSIQAFDRGRYQPYGISIAGDRILLSAWPVLTSCPKTGCTGTFNDLGSGPFVSTVSDGSFLYVAFFGWGEVQRCPLAGCEPGNGFVMSQIKPMSVAVDADNVYVADFDALGAGAAAGAPGVGRVLQCPIEGCPGSGPEVVEAEGISPYAVATYGGRIYFTNVVHGTVVSLSR